jgi:hypothetical protein
MFDVLILVAPKDFNKLPFVCESIVKNINGVHKFYFVSPCAIPDEKLFVDGECFIDREVVDFDFPIINAKERRGWYCQQFIKLFQEVTLRDYLVVDADVYINRPLLVDSKYPTFFLGREQRHEPYFQLMKEVVNLDRVYPHSFISEIMYFKRDVIQ